MDIKALRIVQVSDTRWGVERQIVKGMLWWRKQVWEPYGLVYDPELRTYVPRYGLLPGGTRRRYFESIQEAEDFILKERTPSKYPIIIREYPAVETRGSITRYATGF